jgi:hypothetical protein
MAGRAGSGRLHGNITIHPPFANISLMTEQAVIKSTSPA